MAEDRRRHRMFITQNTEYHLRKDVCVGVRDRRTGRWYRHHAALRMHALREPQSGDHASWVGHRMQLIGNGTDITTSTLVDIGRPPRISLEHYVSLECVGEIELTAPMTSAPC